MGILLYIGRKVWFRPNDSLASVEVWDKEQALDATIVFVHSDYLINLSVIDHGGAIHSIRSVRLVQDDPVPATGFYAEWMPFQIGQAKAAA